MLVLEAVGRVVDMCYFFLVGFAGGIGAAPFVSALLPCYLWTFLPFLRFLHWGSVSLVCSVGRSWGEISELRC